MGPSPGKLFKLIKKYIPKMKQKRDENYYREIQKTARIVKNSQHHRLDSERQSETKMSL